MNILDTRDLYKRQQELQSDLSDLEDELLDAKNYVEEAVDEGEDHSDDCDCDLCEEVRRCEEALADWKDEYEEELKELDSLELEIGSEFMHGTTLIDVDDFEEYAEELAEDIGAIDRNASWPAYHIDWEAAAKDLSQDYSVCTYEGIDYYYRA